MNLFGGDWNEWKLALMAPRSLSGRVVALALVLVVLVLAFRSLRGEQPRRRWLLLGLRTVGILATLLLFFQPTIRLRAVSRMPNHIAVVVDASESMRLAEEGGGEHRAERAAAHLRAESVALQKWRTDHKVEFYTFGDRLQSSTWDSVTHPDVASLRADSTRIREALSAVRQRYEGRDLAGVVRRSTPWPSASPDCATLRSPGCLPTSLPLHAPPSRSRPACKSSAPSPPAGAVVTCP